MKLMKGRGIGVICDFIFFFIYIHVCIVLSYCERAEVRRSCSDLFKGISRSLSVHQSSPFKHGLFSPFVGLASF